MSGKSIRDTIHRIISDNGPEFIARNFKQFIRSGMTHVRTSPYYLQSNGKLERYHRTLKSDCLRPLKPLSLGDTCRATEDSVTRYNQDSAIGYVTLRDKIEGREQEVFAERDRKLTEARQQRTQRRRQDQVEVDSHAMLHTDWAEDTALRGRNRSADPVAGSEGGDLPATPEVTASNPSLLAPMR